VLSTTAMLFVIHAPPTEVWLHELKLDGYRLQIIKEGHQVRLYSRRGYDWTVSLRQRPPCGRSALAPSHTPSRTTRRRGNERAG
jgi:ATP-dependent DNA ligase